MQRKRFLTTLGALLTNYRSELKITKSGCPRKNRSLEIAPCITCIKRCCPHLSDATE